MSCLREMPSEEVLCVARGLRQGGPDVRAGQRFAEPRWHVCTACGDFEILTTGSKSGTTPAPRRAAEVPSISPCTCCICRSWTPSSFSPNAGALVVEIIRKGELPQPEDVPAGLRAAASCRAAITLREPRPVGFPLLFTSDMQLIEPAIAFLHEHAIQRAHTADTVRTYAEILYDWFDALEQSGIAVGRGRCG